MVFLAASAVGVLQIGLLDPLPLLARSLGTAVLPMIHTATIGFTGWLKDSGIPPVIALGGVIQSAADYLILPYRQAVFHGVLSIGLVFVVIIALNRVFTRFWCRGICPLGALLGLFSRYAIFGLEKKPTACDHCNLCLVHCQGADNPNVGDRWRQAECHLCLNCQAACPQGALRFTFFPEHEKADGSPPPTQKPDLTRREAALSVVGGVAAFALFRSGDAFAKNAESRLIRPPGSAVEDDFLARCIRCGQCMRVCPNNALHPTLLEAGAEGIWTPILIPKIGYCEPTCTLCGQVCPNRGDCPYDCFAKGRDRGLTTESHRDGVRRSQPLSALVVRHGLHCLRGVVSNIAQSHLLAGRNRIRPRWHPKAGSSDRTLIRSDVPAAAHASMPARLRTGRRSISPQWGNRDHTLTRCSCSAGPAKRPVGPSANTQYQPTALSADRHAVETRRLFARLWVTRPIRLLNQPALRPPADAVVWSGSVCIPRYHRAIRLNRISPHSP